ncbi:hypothetical protein M569_10216 [Genlisea aurea]|uniref:Uncharacterized protein n=1 Tax=Genlisea aurea TaxID=192259 RepID=S8CCE1_9LAMI|nr:hypothetical protein M569_10216 [Genlisea aurea]
MVKGRKATKASAEDIKGNPNSVEDPTGKGETSCDFNNVRQRKKANLKAQNKVIRRSDRIKGFVSPDSIQKGKPSAVAHILVSDTEEKDDDEEEEEEKEVEQENDTNNQSVGNGLSLEQKLDYLIKAVNEITSSQHFPRSPDNDAPQISTSSSRNGLLDPEQKIEYLVKAVDEIKSQYFVSNPDIYVSRYPGLEPVLEKKIEDLMEINYKLGKEWEFVKGQYEVYRNFFNDSERIEEPTAGDGNNGVSNTKMMQKTYKRRSAATRSSSRTKRKVSIS